MLIFIKTTTELFMLEKEVKIILIKFLILKKSGKKYYDWIKKSLLKENFKLENMEVLEIV